MDTFQVQDLIPKLAWAVCLELQLQLTSGAQKHTNIIDFLILRVLVGDCVMIFTNALIDKHLSYA